MQTNEAFQVKLQYHDTLNPQLWNERQELDPEVRDHLLAIAEQWQTFAHIDGKAVHDIIITGGNVNYNYTEQSDIDIHFICDWDKMPIKDNELLMDFLFAKKDLWAKKHNITVKGYPVELFAQPKDKPFPVGQGVYSILHGQWIVKPENQNYDFNAQRDLRSAIRGRMNDIRGLVKQNAPVEDAESYKDSLAASRGASIQQDGEFAKDNLIYKDLRNRGYLDKLSKYIQAKRDALLSL